MYGNTVLIKCVYMYVSIPFMELYVYIIKLCFGLLIQGLLSKTFSNETMREILALIICYDNILIWWLKHANFKLLLFRLFLRMELLNSVLRKLFLCAYMMVTCISEK